MDNRKIPNIPEDKRRKTILRERIVFPVVFGVIAGLLTYAVMMFFHNITALKFLIIYFLKNVLKIRINRF